MNVFSLRGGGRGVRPLKWLIRRANLMAQSTDHRTYFERSAVSWSTQLCRRKSPSLVWRPVCFTFGGSRTQTAAWVMTMSGCQSHQRHYSSVSSIHQQISPRNKFLRNKDENWTGMRMELLSESLAFTVCCDSWVISWLICTLWKMHNAIQRLFSDLMMYLFHIHITPLMWMNHLQCVHKTSQSQW